MNDFKVTSSKRYIITGFLIKVFELQYCLYRAYVYAEINDNSCLVSISSTYTKEEEATQAAFNYVKEYNSLKLMFNK